MTASFRFRLLAFAGIVLLLCIVSHSIYRDIQLSNQNTGDLRNRVVGARLQKDGRDPYFYKWKKEDGYRYFDAQNNYPGVVSNITASPAFHNLLMPICNLSQKNISVIWLWLQYSMLGIMIFLFLKLSKNIFQKWSVVSFALLFLCTEAWKHHVYKAQLYLFIAFLISIIIYGLLKKEKRYHWLMAAISSALLVLVKPTALIIFIPFVFQFRYFHKYLIASFAFIIMYGAFALLNNKEKGYWISYNKSLSEQLKIHQHLGPDLIPANTLPALTKLEGFFFEDMTNNNEIERFHIKTENGNIFVLYRHLFNKPISVAGLIALFILTAFILMGGFIIKKVKTGVTLPQTIILAFLLYMLSELYGPIYRHQYYTVQWLPILLTGILVLNKLTTPVSLLIILGLVLNILNTTFIPWEHTIGEFCWLLALTLIIFKKTSTNNIKWNLP